MPQRKFIVGVTGTIGAGKGTVAELLQAAYGFTLFSVRAYLERELQRRGTESNRDTMTALANEIRAEHGSSFIIEQLYAEAVEHGGNAVIESIRTVGEIEYLRTLPHFTLIGVDADALLRYERIRARGASTDTVSYETFLAQEKRESESDDPGVQNLVACLSRANAIIDNSGTKANLGSAISHVMQDVFAPPADPMTPMLKTIMSGGFGESLTQT